MVVETIEKVPAANGTVVFSLDFAHNQTTDAT